MERSFAEDVKQLGYGAGQVLHGEGILGITKALLESGVSYVGGYPGAPVSHLIDVLADANEPLLRPMGVYFEQSGILTPQMREHVIERALAANGDGLTLEQLKLVVLMVLWNQQTPSSRLIAEDLLSPASARLPS